MPMTIVPTGAALGAEIRGVDLSRELDDETFQQIDAAFAEHIVIFFRDQNISPDQHIAFSRRFGSLETHILKEALLPGYPEIIVISNIIENGRNIGLADAGSNWHTDLSYMPKPSRCSILYAIEVPHLGDKPLGSTLFSNTAAAYDALSQDIKTQALRLKAYFRYKRVENTSRALPDVVHPIIRTHPITGRKCIYVNQGPTIDILGLNEDDSRSLLTTLCHQATHTDFVYRHDWRPGDVLIWDNCSSQHKATFDYSLPKRRLMHRTTIEGSIPF